MCSINHDLKAIYIHIPKNGGLFIEEILEKYYDFKTLYLTRTDHHIYDNKTYKDYLENGFSHIIRGGFLRYYKTSTEHDVLTDMNNEKWNNYFKFTFVRNPYTKIVSAYNYVSGEKNNGFFKFLNNINIVNNYTYTHSFITQFDHLCDESNNINIDYIGRFENLNEELVNILFKLGIVKIKHGDYIKNNILINNSKKNNYIDFYNINVINKVNSLFEKDFNTFNYTKVENMDELRKILNIQNFADKNKILYEYLHNNNLLM